MIITMKKILHFLLFEKKNFISFLVIIHKEIKIEKHRLYKNEYICIRSIRFRTNNVKKKS